MKRTLALFLAVLLVAPQLLAQSDSQIQADIQKTLKNDRFRNVQASVKNGEVDLTGTVEVYDSKVQADQRVRRVKGVTSVRDDIQVAGAEISDRELQNKLVEAISYDRVGYRTTPFNAISVQVQNGAVTLGGHAYGPVDADSAVAVAANTKGVKDVIDDIQVDPVSLTDDRIRLKVFRAVYGFPTLNKYAIDPAKPIRIQVANGHVALYGTVDSEADKNAAGLRANGVAGVFSVTNNLQVASGTSKED